MLCRCCPICHCCCRHWLIASRQLVTSLSSCIIIFCSMLASSSTGYLLIYLCKYPIVSLVICTYPLVWTALHTHTHTTVLRPFFWDHPCEPVPEENFCTLWCKTTEADTPIIWLGATPSGLASAHHNHPPIFTGRMPFLPPNQQCQSSEGN